MTTKSSTKSANTKRPARPAADATRVVLFDADGRARKASAHALRIQLADGRSLTLDLSQAGDGVVALLAEHTDTRQQAGLLVRPDNAEALSVAVTATPIVTTTGTPATPAEVELDVQFGDGARKRPGVPARRQIEKWVQSALYADATLTVRFVDEAEGRALNRTYRGKDYATNVLTFAYAEHADDPVTGDIVLCCPVVEAEAKQQKKALEAHYAHLIVHGVLHAQGYEHEEDGEAEEMEAIETETLQALGFNDPYAPIRE